MDYTCAWERTFGLSLQRLPSWVRRRMTLDGPRRPTGVLDLVAVLELSQRIERSAHAQSLIETTKIARATVTRMVA